MSYEQWWLATSVYSMVVQAAGNAWSCFFRALFDDVEYTEQLQIPRQLTFLFRSPQATAGSWGVPPTALSLQQAPFVRTIGTALCSLKLEAAGMGLLIAASHFTSC